ncbi:MAG: hypothetical protein K0U86_19165 [Planctomycetes bacterium]|nr:hypothetical protein [Planctomycetota bacterium]MCH9727028.1 hypothetical protein [Planctomycetota bacterium]MCH9776156.1 hypothetical protein [Planctomycetota bacterium]MCH9791040.1 hypothetical protein [Planctomycetota bacterium]
MVRAFTDFKRHTISDTERPHFGNELLLEKYLPFNTFLTKRLWATGNTAPYGHRGDLPTIQEAISHHGGEATKSRRAFESLKKSDQRAIIEFLRSLQILKEGSPAVIIKEKERRLPYQNSQK